MTISVNEKKDNQWVILKSNSWIKGTSDCIDYAEKKNLPYKLVGGVSYEEMLKTLSKSKGLIFLPKAGDTCPRIVIEAYLLGCQLILNKNVMHKDEKWFSKDRLYCYEYLKGRSSFFWDKVSSKV